MESLPISATNSCFKLHFAFNPFKFQKLRLFSHSLSLSLIAQVAAEGVSFQDDWPYAIHLLALIYAGDINSARFLWKSMPVAVKESNPEVIAAWKIGQKLWVRDFGGVYEAIRGYEWSQDAEGLVAAFSDLYTKKMFQLLQSAYSTISIQDTALFLGMSEDDVTTYVLQQGWVVDPASQMVTVKKQPIVTEQKLDASKLQSLTEYVFHLEH
ncbi:COP9 signalosome complex subunit 8 [Pyrus ussuriensis x Pyrus communis]|uniref:COP9 signalosome complex subunit 8 n=1 Tax=Pyrus ussuriensis x Pyrus communis TaxID=2448454 RepID=A0A5N5HQD7_9ROSA|nr:COP9 signalosome complex subunit 8 [Pyrus ussuriensis x Pyrus communis]